MRGEGHTGINEKREKFHGLWYVKKHSVRSLKSARARVRKYVEMGYLALYEIEKPGFYNVYVRRHHKTGRK